MYKKTITGISPKISPSDSGHYTHTNLSRIKTEFGNNRSVSPPDGAIILHMIE